MGVKPALEPNQAVLVRHLHNYDHDKAGHAPATVCDFKLRYPTADFLGGEEHVGEDRDTAGVVNVDCDPALKRPQAKGIPQHFATYLPGIESYTRITHRDGPREHHAGVVNVKNPNRTLWHGTAPAYLRGEVEKQGGFLVYNHPEYDEHYPWDGAQYPDIDKALDYLLPLDEARAFHAVELFNDTLSASGNRADKVLAWVERNFYARGLTPAMVTGSDDHAKSHTARRPSFTVALAEKTPDAFVAAVRKGQTYVTATRQAKLSQLAIDDEHRLGDRPSFRRFSEHVIDVQLEKLPKGSTVELVINGTIVGSSRTRDGQFSQTYPFHAEPVPGTDRGYAYVRVYEPKGHLTLVTSALSFDVRD